MAYAETPIRTVLMSGSLAKRFGREFKYRAHNVPKAISAMKNLLPGFDKFMMEAHLRGLTFAIFVGKRNIGVSELELTNGTDVIRIVPVIVGSKRGGLFQTILGVALIGAAFITGGLSIAAWGTVSTGLAMMGASMALGGVIQMLSPQQSGLAMRQSPDNKPSYAFGGPVNSTAQGNPVGVLYGKRRIGGAVISAGIFAEDQM
ncbi:tail assembly protein [Yersinia canariae]|uniref:tail assembly protein n=1 Tax=Yersinia canariae TaxID=2607663 RepID=UPI0011A3F401|nr:tail assembly protein [Yersinia canariae]